MKEENCGSDKQEREARMDTRAESAWKWVRNRWTDANGRASGDDAIRVTSLSDVVEVAMRKEREKG